MTIVNVRSPQDSAEEFPFTGNLDEDAAFRIYYRICSAGLSGNWRLDDPPRSYRIYFKKGIPYAVHPSRQEEDIGSFLVYRKVITKLQLEEARTQTGNAEVISGLCRILPPNEVFNHWTAHSLSLLLRALLLKNGTYSFDYQDALPTGAIALGNSWALLCDVIRNIPLKEIRLRLGARLDRPLMKSGGKVEISQLKLTPQQVRVASFFDGVRSLNQLCSAVPQDASIILNTGFLFYCVDLCSFGNTEVSSCSKISTEASPPPAGSKSSSPPRIGPPKKNRPADHLFAKYSAPLPETSPATASTIPLDQTREIEFLRSFKKELETKNHFQILNIAENASETAIKSSFFQLAKKYHPDTSARGSAMEISKLKEQIFARIHEAYSVLSDPKQRKNYMELMRNGATDSIDPASIFASEEAFQKGCIFVKARNFSAAVEKFCQAIDLYNQEGEYYVWRGWARFLSAQDKRAIRLSAIQEIEQGFKLSPRCAEAPYFLGQIHKMLGDSSTARKWFQKTLTLDPKHVDAKRELRQK